MQGIWSLHRSVSPQPSQERPQPGPTAEQPWSLFLMTSASAKKKPAEAEPQMRAERMHEGHYRTQAGLRPSRHQPPGTRWSPELHLKWPKKSAVPPRNPDFDHQREERSPAPDSGTANSQVQCPARSQGHKFGCLCSGYISLTGCEKESVVDLTGPGLSGAEGSRAQTPNAASTSYTPPGLHSPSVTYDKGGR
jgi:hypothetical protein